MHRIDVIKDVLRFWRVWGGGFPRVTAREERAQCNDNHRTDSCRLIHTLAPQKHLARRPHGTRMVTVSDHASRVPGKIPRVNQQGDEGDSFNHALRAPGDKIEHCLRQGLHIKVCWKRRRRCGGAFFPKEQNYFFTTGVGGAAVAATTGLVNSASSNLGLITTL